MKRIPDGSGVLFLAVITLLPAGCSDTPAGSQTPPLWVEDWNFLSGRFFFITDPDSAPVPRQVLDVRLYLDDHVARNDVELAARQGVAWVDPDVRVPADSVTGHFHLLIPGDADDYVLYDAGPIDQVQIQALPSIELRNRLLYNHTLAVAYSYVTGVGTVDTVGTLLAVGDTTTALQLKLLRPADEQWDTPDGDLRKSPFASCRRLEMKNIYDLGIRNIDPGSFELTIVRDLAGENGNNPVTLENRFAKSTDLLEVLGLDQVNNLDRSRTPDGKVDPEYVDYQRGYLFFPDLRPFDPSLADIAGSPVAGGRIRSWPVDPAASRPDTLGWEVDAGTGNAVPSPQEWRDAETVPEIYDLLPAYLQAVAATYHRYAIEIVNPGGIVEEP